MSKALVVNLYAGPGTGKSTTAARLFARLKQDGYDAELVHEYAKDLTWEERHKTLAYAPYVFGKQSFHVHRVVEKVEVVVTDSPILLTNVYKGEGWTEELGEHVRKTYHAWDTFDAVLRRNEDAHPYNPNGRNQTREEAMSLDGVIQDTINYVSSDTNFYTAIDDYEFERLVADVEDELQERRNA